ncbi:MAG: transglycosylase domain-containing protein [Candidatus Sabulitectum sp.]|nr:transglycosylase domain-containing protein [Candidatus Sabulitectum sp.]
MTGTGKQSISFLRLAVSLLSITLLIFLIHTFVSVTVKNRLTRFDAGCTFEGLEYGLNSLVVRNLQMPGIGIFSRRVSVLMSSDLFHPIPLHVVLHGVEIQPDFSQSSPGPASRSTDLPVISVIDGRIPVYSTEFYGTRINGIDMGYAGGDWGELFINRAGDSISVSFNNFSSIPGMEEVVPDMARGHRISGRCTGVLGQVSSISGLITEIDGKSASVLFKYRLQEGRSSTSFSMDFSQVADPAMALLDSLSSGAIMTAVPSGSLFVDFPGNDTIFFYTDLRFDSVSIWSTAVVQDTFSTEAAISCGGFILREPGLVVVDSGTISSYEVDLAFNLRYSWGERRKLNLVISNPALPGEAIIASIPPEFFGCLRGLTLGGKLSIFTELTLDWEYPDSSDINLNIDASQLTVGYSPITFGRIRNLSGAECFMRDSWGNSARIGLDTLTNPGFVFYDSLPLCFEPLLRCAEDASFRGHNGFSEYHIRNSIRANMSQESFIRGGSTISMQLAKNLFLGREKTLARKLQEVFLTWRLERWLSKERILEIYANIVELGPGVFGFNSAAMYYFNETVSDLSVREMAFLVSILPGPALYHRYAVRGVLPSYWKSYVERLITICGSRGWLEGSAVSEAVAETLIFDGAVSLP